MDLFEKLKKEETKIEEWTKLITSFTKFFTFIYVVAILVTKNFKIIKKKKLLKINKKINKKIKLKKKKKKKKKKNHKKVEMNMNLKILYGSMNKQKTWIIEKIKFKLDCICK